MSGQLIMQKKRIIFMRHGSIMEGVDYETLNYEELMNHLTKRKDPDLEDSDKKSAIDLLLSLFNKQNEVKDFKIDNIPENIDLICHSPSRRTIQTAKIIRKKLNNKPVIENSIKKYLAEVKFSNNIITKKEFEDNKGFKGCRSIILERWFRGKNKESFSDSFERVKKLDKFIKDCKYKNILFITHGFYLRLIYLFYQKQITIDKATGKLKKETLQYLFRAPRLKYGGFLEWEYNGISSLIPQPAECDELDNIILKKEVKIRKCDEEKVRESLNIYAPNPMQPAVRP
ncbi:MAG: hypothetical protein GF353_13155 [Candidatus Lokiarchaeota archaeon]|nr:hypothetical protein [Candidatus Lokiarchaeota archaeon]